MASARDHSLDTLLDLHGQTLFVDETGHWVKFVVQRTAVAPDRPHGAFNSLTLHAPDGTRLVGFDNAHPVQTDDDPENKNTAKGITNTGSGQSDPTSTRMLPPCSQTSGALWTAC